MCTTSSAPSQVQPSSLYSTRQKIDRLIQALSDPIMDMDCAASSASIENEDESSSPLSSSLQGLYATAGIFDSLILSHDRRSRQERDAQEREEEEEASSADDQDEPEFDLADLLMCDMDDDDDDDDILRQFDNSWDDILMNADRPSSVAAPRRSIMGSRQRSGVRRGCSPNKNTGTYVVAVPTKQDDGPSSSRRVAGARKTQTGTVRTSRNAPAA